MKLGFISVDSDCWLGTASMNIIDSDYETALKKFKNEQPGE